MHQRRYTLSAPVCREVLARLLQLNHERAQAETAGAGQPEGKPSSRAKAPRGKKKGEEGPPRLL